MELLIFTAKFLIFLKRLTAAFFIRLIFKPSRFVLRLFFYKIIVKIYGAYLSAIKKLGWPGFKKSFFLFLLSHKLTHVAVFTLAVVLIFINLTTRAHANSTAETAGKTILAGIIESEFENPEEEQLIEEFFDQEASISPTQQSYLENLSGLQSQPTVNTGPIDEYAESKNISDEDEMSGLFFDGSALIKSDTASVNAKRVRKEIIYYTVASGDTVSTMAREYGISVNTILWENNLSAYSMLRPGNKITILPISGVRHEVARGDNLEKIAAKYNIGKDDIINANENINFVSLALGEKIIIPGGKKYSYTRYEPRSVSGFKALTDLADLIKKPRDAKPTTGNKMAWPTVGYRITQYYSWRHHALDIANKIGTPLYAADAGVIEVIGWGRGYGNQIVINHGGGKKTRYGHLSKFYTQKGQSVNKGEVIGAMGSTGWSTGPHLHFEIIIDGIKYNPLNYIK